MDLTIIAVLCFILYLFPIVLPRESRLRYYSCYASYISVLLTTCLIGLPFQFLQPSIAYKIPEVAADLLSKILGIEWDVRNKEILNNHKNSVIIINHQSMFDLFAGVVAFRPVNKYMAVMKKEIKYIFPLGQAFKLNTIFIDRKNNIHLAMALIREKLMSTDKNLVIFPEGTRNRKGEPFLPFKKGAFRIAVELKRPIIPAVVSPYYFIKPGMFTGGKVIIKILEPIETADVKEEDINDLIENTRNLMEEEYMELKREVMMGLENKTK